MKSMKKGIAIALVIIMTVLMTVPAMAETLTQNVNNETDHDYKAYQIFSGTQADGDSALGDVAWGSDIDQSLAASGKTKIVEELSKSKYFASCTTAKAVADILAGKGDRCAEAVEFSQIAHRCLKADATGKDIPKNSSSVQLENGYYLIVDQTEVADSVAGLDGKDPAIAKNPAILQVTKKGDIHIAMKYSVPAVEKQVADSNKVYGSHMDLNIGDDANYRIIGSLPTNLNEFAQYNYCFKDTLSKGLTYNEDAEVYIYLDGNVANNDSANKVKITSKFETPTTSVEAGTGKTTLTINCVNLAEKDGEGNYKITGMTTTSKIVLEYTAKLNSDAAIGNTESTVPGNGNEAYIIYSNDPNGTGYGKTVTDTAFVFTFELDVKKVDGGTSDLKPLKDAEFTLSRTVKVDGSDVTQYAVVSADGKLTGWTATEAEATKLKSGTDGICKVVGLDAGTYTLTEVKAPAGYNKLSDPYTLVIEPTYQTVASSGTDMDSIKVVILDVSRGTETYEHTGNPTTGSVTATVKNEKGLSLPETGGMGTTILYALGGVFIVVSGILLVTKKRVSREK